MDVKKYVDTIGINYRIWFYYVYVKHYKLIDYVFLNNVSALCARLEQKVIKIQLEITLMSGDCTLAA